MYCYSRGGLVVVRTTGTGRDEEAIIRMVDESSPRMNPEEKLFAASNDGKRAKRDEKE